MLVATGLLSKCARAPKPEPCYFPTTYPPPPAPPPRPIRPPPTRALHRTPTSMSSMCAYTLAPRSSSTLKRPRIAPSARPSLSCPRAALSIRSSPPRSGTAVGITLLPRHRVHASPTSFTYSSSANPLHANDLSLEVY
jgi:hypothetical protein